MAFVLRSSVMAARAQRHPSVMRGPAMNNRSASVPLRREGRARRALHRDELRLVGRSSGVASIQERAGPSRPRCPRDARAPPPAPLQRAGSFWATRTCLLGPAGR